MTDSIIQERVCKRCAVSKPLTTNFDRHSKGSEARRNVCNECRKVPLTHRVINAKVCARCKTEKPAAEFAKDNRRVDRMQAYCKECHNAESRRRFKFDVCDRRAKAKIEGERWRRAHPIKWNGLSRQWRLTARAEVIEHYSHGTNACECCGDAHIEFLCIDHTHGNGNKHRRDFGISDMPTWLKSHGLPTGFRVLCHNCNGSLGHYGYCPHDIG